MVTLYKSAKFMPRNGLLNNLRSLFTQSITCNKNGYNNLQRARLAKKFLSQEKWQNKKIKCEEKKVSLLSSSSLKKGNGDFSHRMKRLNKVFMEKITEIISTTDICDHLIGKGFEITKTEVQKGFIAVYVYWYCSNSKYDEEINRILLSSSSFIRQELKIHQIVGSVPPIIFIRDDAHKTAVEVDKLLLQADYGEDFDPSHPSLFYNSFTAKPEIFMKDYNRIEGSSDATESSIKMYPTDKLPIRHDVFGVDRRKIMNMVRKGQQSSLGSHRKSQREAELKNYEKCSEDREKPVELLLHSRSEEMKKWVTSYKKQRQRMKRSCNETNKLSYVPPYTTIDDDDFLDDLSVYPDVDDEISTYNDDEFERQ